MSFPTRGRKVLTTYSVRGQMQTIIEQLREAATEVEKAATRAPAGTATPLMSSWTSRRSSSAAFCGRIRWALSGPRRHRHRNGNGRLHAVRIVSNGAAGWWRVAGNRYRRRNVRDHLDDWMNSAFPSLSSSRSCRSMWSRCTRWPNSLRIDSSGGKLGTIEVANSRVGRAASSAS